MMRIFLVKFRVKRRKRSNIFEKGKLQSVREVIWKRRWEILKHPKVMKLIGRKFMKSHKKS